MPRLGFLELGTYSVNAHTILLRQRFSGAFPERQRGILFLAMALVLEALQFNLFRTQLQQNFDVDAAILQG